MKIAIIAGPLGKYAGIERVVFSQSNHLASLGETVYIVSPRLRIEPGAVAAEVELRSLDNSKVGSGLGNILGLAKLVREIKPDVCIANDLSSIVAGRFGRKLIHYSHGGHAFDPYATPIVGGTGRNHLRAVPLALSYHLTDLIIANSKWCMSTFLTRDINAESVYPGVDTQLFRPLGRTSARQELLNRSLMQDYLRDEDPLFLNVGWFRGNKRQELLVEAFKQVIRKYPKAKIAFIGRGWRLDEIWKIVKSYGLTESVIFSNEGINDHDLRLWYCSANAYVHMNDREHFGIPVAEALSCGVPGIVPDSGGPSEIIRNGITGFYYLSGNPTSLADTMVRMVKFEDYSRMRMACREDAISKFDFSIAGKKLHSLIHTLAG
ncbi:MAG: glycosyltransferase family 4 protein [Nitrososphaerales archaeon]